MGRILAFSLVVCVTLAFIGVGESQDTDARHCTTLDPGQCQNNTCSRTVCRLCLVGGGCQFVKKRSAPYQKCCGPDPCTICFTT